MYVYTHIYIYNHTNTYTSRNNINNEHYQFVLTLILHYTHT